jgi:L-2-hydroxyglutarate oxidase
MSKNKSSQRGLLLLRKRKDMKKHSDVIIIGGGIIGFSSAMQLLQRDSSLKITLLEKESTFAQHQTGHNSGVIHAGVYYKPGSLKAKFCLEGCQATKEFCQKHNIPFQVPGKLIVATNKKELTWMKNLIARCKENGLTVEELSAEELNKRQPGLNSVGGFFVKETGIVNWKTVCQEYAKQFTELGGEICYNETVSSIKETETQVTVTTKQGNSYTADYLIACAGLYSDRIAQMAGIKTNFKVVPFRGEYYRLSPKYDNYFKHLIYPVPDPGLPFLGMHFTPQVEGFTTAGPTALLALAREGYSWKHFNLKEVLEIFSYLPTWRMTARHFKTALNELHSSLSKKRYLKLIQHYCSEIQLEDIKPYPAGVRAQAVDNKGNFIQDFLFLETKRTLHTCNTPSPAATSSLPIGRYIVDLFINKQSTNPMKLSAINN